MNLSILRKKNLPIFLLILGIIAATPIEVTSNTLIPSKGSAVLSFTADGVNRDLVKRNCKATQPLLALQPNPGLISNPLLSGGIDRKSDNILFDDGTGFLITRGRKGYKFVAVGLKDHIVEILDFDEDLEVASNNRIEILKDSAQTIFSETSNFILLRYLGLYVDFIEIDSKLKIHRKWKYTLPDGWEQASISFRSLKLYAVLGKKAMIIDFSPTTGKLIRTFHPGVENMEFEISYSDFGITKKGDFIFSKQSGGVTKSKSFNPTHGSPIASLEEKKVIIQGADFGGICGLVIDQKGGHSVYSLEDGMPIGNGPLKGIEWITETNNFVYIGTSSGIKYFVKAFEMEEYSVPKTDIRFIGGALSPFNDDISISGLEVVADAKSPTLKMITLKGAGGGIVCNSVDLQKDRNITLTMTHPLGKTDTIEALFKMTIPAVKTTQIIKSSSTSSASVDQGGLDILREHMKGRLRLMLILLIMSILLCVGIISLINCIKKKPIQKVKNIITSELSNLPPNDLEDMSANDTSGM